MHVISRKLNSAIKGKLVCALAIQVSHLHIMETVLVITSPAHANMRHHLHIHQNLQGNMATSEAAIRTLEADSQETQLLQSNVHAALQ